MHKPHIHRDPRPMLKQRTESLAAAEAPQAVARKLDRAIALQRRGDLAGAIRLYRQVVAASPRLANARNNLGAALFADGAHEEAIRCFARAAELRPGYRDALANLATALEKLRRYEPLIDALRALAAVVPDDPRVFRRLGKYLLGLKRYAEAGEAFERAAELAPRDPDALADLASSRINLRRHSEAVRICREALELDPGHPGALSMLGAALRGQGLINDAISATRAAWDAAPDLPWVGSNLLLLLQGADSITPEEVFQEHLAVARTIEACVTPLPYRPDERPEAHRLRIGYVSPDLRGHSVAFFAEAVLREHDHDGVELFCYYDWPHQDPTSLRLRGYVDHWRECYSLTDEEMAARIRADEIDVLIDLGGHTSGARPQLFARRPAPVQFTYLGYPGTTGLAAMDYRITDEISDPVGTTEHLHTEELIRLSGGFLAYTPPSEAGPVAPPPCLRNGHVTFGSFNQLVKLNDEVIRLWARVLGSVPDSRLVLKTRCLEEAEVAGRIRAAFERHGVETDRIDLVGVLPLRSAHLDYYGRLDVALDPFPYNGTTTTCEALWMGVPVLTLAGRHHASRVSASLLTTIGRKEWVAESEEEYVALARRLAADPAGLASARFALRSRIRASPLLDGRRVARQLEEAYRRAWAGWRGKG